MIELWAITCVNHGKFMRQFWRINESNDNGVNGPNPQVLGPVHTKAVALNSATAMAATAQSMRTYLLVSAPVHDDANLNSTLRVALATSDSGPWTQVCGPQTNGPRQCRIHGLTNGVAYFVRVTNSDPDGVNGPRRQVIGPVLYTGLTNLVLNQAITADPGWGCCANPRELVNGRIQNNDWSYGFAWTGGTGGWGGGRPGNKHAIVNLGTVQSVTRLDVWTHDPGNVPLTWHVSVSTDGVTYTPVFSTSEARCRLAAEPLWENYWGFPACGQSAQFRAVNAQFVQYVFDDTTLFDGIHGWAVELEVFGPTAGATPDGN